MTHLFENCISLTSIDLTNFISGDLIDMTYMFYGCTSAKEITFGPEFTARKVDNMYQLFKGCLSLKSVDLSRFHPKDLIETAEMFFDCINLVQVRFYPKLVLKDMRHMESMFYGCNNTCFTCVDMRGFEIPEDVKVNDFNKNTNLNNIVDENKAKPIYNVLSTNNKKLMKENRIRCAWVDHCICFNVYGRCNRCEKGYKLKKGICVD